MNARKARARRKQQQSRKAVEREIEIAVQRNDDDPEVWRLIADCGDEMTQMVTDIRVLRMLFGAPDTDPDEDKAGWAEWTGNLIISDFAQSFGMEHTLRCESCQRAMQMDEQALQVMAASQFDLLVNKGGVVN